MPEENWSLFRWVLVVGLAVSVVTTLQFVLWPLQPSPFPEARELENELFRLEQRQKMINREMLALSVSLARTNETWREQAVTSMLQRRAERRNRPTNVVASEEDAFTPETAPTETPGPPQDGTTRPPWGAGPPPDAYFEATCAEQLVYPRSFYVYPSKASEACNRGAMSWRMEPSCPGADGRARENSKLRRQVLVTGVQRSGTHFTWEFLNRLGVHVHHEGLGPAGAVSWLYTWRAGHFVINNPAPLSPDHRFCVVLHQVRHPLRVISSIVKATKPRGDRYWQWIYAQEPTIQKDAPPPIRAAHLWLVQNERIEQFAHARFLVEETSPRDVCRAAGFAELLCGADGRYHTTSSKVIQPIIEPRKIPAAEIDLQPPDPHYRPPAISWADLQKSNPALTQAVIDKALAYGYNRDPRYHPQSLATTEFKA